MTTPLYSPQGQEQYLDIRFVFKDLTPEEKLLKAIYSKEEYLAKEYCDGYNQALSDLQSLLDEEINKVKEL